MYNDSDMLDTSIKIDENTRILAVEELGILMTVNHWDGKTTNIWNNGLIETLDENNEQIVVDKISSKAKLSKIMNYISRKLSKKDEVIESQHR